MTQGHKQQKRPSQDNRHCNETDFFYISIQVLDPNFQKDSEKFKLRTLSKRFKNFNENFSWEKFENRCQNSSFII